MKVMGDEMKKHKDELIEKYFEALENISSLRLQLDNVLGDAYLQMAQARKAMGAGNVSSLQFDHRETAALRHVNICASSQGETELDLLSTEPLKFVSKQAKSDSSSVEEMGSDISPVEEIGSLHLSDLKQTDKGPVPLSSKSDCEESESLSTTDVKNVEGNPVNSNGDDSKSAWSSSAAEDKKPRRDLDDNLEESVNPIDPIRWFGILVPQSLRGCQKSFQRSLPVLCKLSEEQIKLDVIRKEYQAL